MSQSRVEPASERAARWWRRLRGQCAGCPCLFVQCRRVLRARVSRRADASVGASACRCRSRGRGPRGDLIFDVKSEDPPPLEAVHRSLHRCAFAGRVSLLVALESRATPPHETSRILRRAAAMPALTRSTMSSRSYSASVASMFRISRPVDVDGSMPSEIDGTFTPRSRSRFTVFSTSIRERPSRSTRHTTTVSPSSAYSRSFFIPVRSIAVLLPEVTSAKTSRFCTPAATSASSCSCAS